MGKCALILHILDTQFLPGTLFVFIFFLLVFNIFFHFRLVLDLQRNYNDSAASPHICYTLFPLLTFIFKLNNK